MANRLVLAVLPTTHLIIDHKNMTGFTLKNNFLLKIIFLLLSASLLLILFHNNGFDIFGITLYNQNKDVLAQEEEETTSRLVCGKEIPIGEAMEKTVKLINDLILQLSIIDENVCYQIQAAEEMIAYANQCGIENCLAADCGSFQCNPHDCNCDTCYEPCYPGDPLPWDCFPYDCNCETCYDTCCHDPGPCTSPWQGRACPQPAIEASFDIVNSTYERIENSKKEIWALINGIDNGVDRRESLCDKLNEDIRTTAEKALCLLCLEGDGDGCHVGEIPSLPGGTGSCAIKNNTLHLPDILIKGIETAAESFGVPPSLMVGVMYGEGAFNPGSPYFDAAFVEDHFKECAKLPGCDPDASVIENIVPFYSQYWNNLKDAVKVVDPDRVPNACNLLDGIFAVAKDLSQSQYGSSAFSGKTCFGISLNYPGWKDASGSCSWDEVNAETAIRVWEFGTAYNALSCATKENSCLMGGGLAAQCPTGGDTCETKSNRYPNPSHNACIWDVYQNNK